MKGLVLVNTGNGKGKTTAALGLLLRALGHGKRCAVVQFIKSSGFTYGEKETLQKLGVEMHTLGAGCTWNVDDKETSAAIKETWDVAKNIIFSKKYDLVILDEINIALNFAENQKLTFNLKESLLQMIQERPENLHLMLTGRYAPPEIIDIADMVTEMNLVKHHYNCGVQATEGIEF